MKTARLLLLLPFLHGCATMEWTNSYGTDFCAYPSGFIVGVPTALAASIVASAPVAIGVGALTGGTMILNGYNNYGGADIQKCIEDYNRTVRGIGEEPTDDSDD